MTVTRTGAPTITGSRLGWAALAVYLATRAVSTLFILAAGRLQVPYERWTGPGPVTFLDMSVVWDGSWYRTIAEDGYPAELPLSDDGVVRQNQWAFYPLFPMLSRGLMVLTGMDFRLAGTLVALVTGCGAAVLMVRLFARYAPPAVALAAMGVWAVQPAAPTLQIAYTESLAVLVLVGFFLALVQRNWLLVGVLAVVLGVTARRVAAGARRRRRRSAGGVPLVDGAAATDDAHARRTGGRTPRHRLRPDLPTIVTIGTLA